MNVFTIYFHKILAKYSSKPTKLHHLKKKSLGSMQPSPLRAIHANSSTFPKII